MPTGYTDAIADGISFNNFVMNCARAMKSYITMCDAPHDAEIPEKFKPNTWHAEELEEAEVELARLNLLSAIGADNESTIDYRKSLADYEKLIAKGNMLRIKYELMLSKVDAWATPSSDHEPFKRFMQDQIRISIDSDCDMSYFKPPKRLTGEKWLAKHIKALLQDIDYHTKKNDEENERVAGCNLWVKQLRDSLKA